MKILKSIEQQCAIQLYAKLGKTASEILEALKIVYEKAALSLAQVFMWHKIFRGEMEAVEDDQCLR